MYNDLIKMKKALFKREEAIYNRLHELNINDDGQIDEIHDLWEELDEVRLDLDWVFWETEERNAENMIIAEENYIFGYSHRI